MSFSIHVNSTINTIKKNQKNTKTNLSDKKKQKKTNANMDQVNVLCFKEHKIKKIAVRTFSLDHYSVVVK